MAQCGVNDVLLSVDAFHQETIPLAPVREFAEALLRQGVPLHTHPAWLVGPAHDNPYNRRTNEILAEFQAIGVARSDGNVIHPAGNALLWLRDYFEQDVRSVSPYEEDPRDMRAVCVDPDGSVAGGNLHDAGMLDILDAYVPPGEPSA